MKRKLLKAVLLALMLALAFPVAAAEPAAEQKSIKYTPIPQIGVPLKITSGYDWTLNKTVRLYTGTKKISAGFITPGVSLSVVSNRKEIVARPGENSLYIENNGLRTGETSEVTVTATCKGYEPVVQTVKIKITDGSEAHPHIILSKEDLMSIPEMGLDKNYRQSADIDLTKTYKWTTIGSAAQPFTGVYDGDGFRIMNMEFSEIPDAQYPGLFGVVYGKSAKITGVKLDGKIDSTNYPVNWHGSIAGLLDGGTISDCAFTGDITLGKGKMLAGGITSDVINGGAIINCSYAGKIFTQNNNSHIGGISGTLDGIIEDCTVTGKISSESAETNAGGITGLNFGTIKNCVVKGDLGRFGVGGNLGGIAGRNDSVIQNCAYAGGLYSKGNENKAGGIAGYNFGEITASAVKGSVGFAGDALYIGGIAGRNQSGKIENTAVYANITGSGLLSFIGGIAGENYSVIDRNNVGRANASVAAISNCLFSGDIKLNGDTSMAGGAAGRNLGYSSISGGTEKNALSLITNVVIRAGIIDAKKAGRIVAENTLTSIGNKYEAVHEVLLIDNAAFEMAIVNDKPVEGNPSANSINGQSMSNEALDELEAKNNLKPPALDYIK